MENKRRKRSALDKFSSWCFKTLGKSPIGKFFTSYENVNDKFLGNTSEEKSKTRRAEKTRDARIKRSNTKRKYRLAKMLENNIFAKIVPPIYHFFLRISVSSYASAFLSMGAVALTMFLLNYFGVLTLGNFTVTHKMLILPAILIILSFPMVFIRRSLASAILSIKIFSIITFGFLGVDSENIKNCAYKSRFLSTGISLIIGSALGALSYFIKKPEYVLFALSLIIFAYVIFRTPEIGVILIIFTLPFVNILVTEVAIIYVLIAYIVKIILHKRVITFEYFDIWPAFAIFIMIAFGIDYQNPLNSLPIISMNVTILVSYFLIANLIRSKDWFKKCIFALTSSAFIAATIGIIQAILGTLSVYFPEIGDFSMYESTVNSVFSTYNSFSQYMVIAIPFALVHIFAERKDTSKLGGFLIAVVLSMGLLVARSKSAFIGILVAVLLLLIVYNRNFIYLAFLAVVTPIGLFFGFRNNEYVLRFLRTFDFLREFDPKDKINQLKDGLLTWLDSPFGKGAGGLGVEHDSFLVQILLEYGIVVFIALAVCAIMFARLVFSYCAKEASRKREIYCSAGFCALCGIFATGIFANVWADTKIMLLSIICMALSFAYIKIEREGHTVKEIGNDLSRASIDIQLSDDDEYDLVSEKSRIRLAKPKKKRKMVGDMSVTQEVKIKDGFEDDDDAPDDDEDRV